MVNPLAGSKAPTLLVFAILKDTTTELEPGVGVEPLAGSEAPTLPWFL
jgi:hypothetical protein